MLYQLLLVLLPILVARARANVEKIIFLAPALVHLPDDTSLDHLYLTSLNPRHPTVRTHLNATFPTPADSKGTESWFLLEGLQPSQRYEARVCWLATQPTNFWLYTHLLDDVFETPQLMTSLTSYAYQRRDRLGDSDVQQLQLRRRRSATMEVDASLLLLQVFAAADYFTLNETLMKEVPPVFVDIILDPYIMNIFPRSLVPTVAIIIPVAIGAWFLSAWIFVKLKAISMSENTIPSGKKDI